MKKYIYSAMLFTLALGFTACEDDNDDNPVLKPATEFVLNTPTFANQTIHLATSEDLQFVCSQPNFGFPMEAKYSIQYSLDGNFTVSVDQAEADSTHVLVADYQESDNTSSTIITIPGGITGIAKGLQQIAHWSEGLVPSTQVVHFRAKCTPKATTDKDVEKYTIYSNVIDLTVVPTYVELSDAPIVMWYLVGNMFGGKWGSRPGVDALPMFVIPDYSYDKKTGTGELEYINYFVTGPWDDGKNECGSAGFKIQASDFNWDYGLTGDNNVYDKIIYRDGGKDGGHIVAGADGYYRVSVNTAGPSGKIEKYEGAVKDYGKIVISGSFNDWSDTEMVAYNKDGVENHCWMYLAEFDADKEVKFKLAGSWDSNWGGNAFPCGIGENNGPNIKVPAGKWVISFCDITGQYSIIAVQ